MSEPERLPPDFQLSRRFKAITLAVIMLLATVTVLGTSLWLEPQVAYDGRAIPLREVMETRNVFCTNKHLTDLQNRFIQLLHLPRPIICFKSQADLSNYLTYAWEYP